MALTREIDPAPHDEITAFPLTTEAKSFELADDLEGERVIELTYIHIVGADAGLGEAAQSTPFQRGSKGVGMARPGVARRLRPTPRNP